jgi:hypothetical protein
MRIFPPILLRHYSPRHTWINIMIKSYINSALTIPLKLPSASSAKQNLIVLRNAHSLTMELSFVALPFERVPLSPKNFDQPNTASLSLRKNRFTKLKRRSMPSFTNPLLLLLLPLYNLDFHQGQV